MVVQLSLAEARSIALAAQGFDGPRPRRVTIRDLARTIRRLALVQLDYVNVVVPSHYQVPFSRLGPYDRAVFDRVAYRSGEFTEQWAHEASIILVSTWPLLRHRMDVSRFDAWGFTIVDIAWAPGQALGASAGGAVAKATSDAAVYLGLAAVCAATLAAVLHVRRV